MILKEKKNVSMFVWITLLWNSHLLGNFLSLHAYVCVAYVAFLEQVLKPQRSWVFPRCYLAQHLIICIRVNCLCNSAAGNTWAVLEEISACSGRSQCLWYLSSVTQDPDPSLNLRSFSWGSSPMDVWNTKLSCPHASSRRVESEWVHVGTCPWLLSCKVLRVENVPTGKWWAFIMLCELQPASQCIKGYLISLSFPVSMRGLAAIQHSIPSCWIASSCIAHPTHLF